jgi:hypothetical protein
MRVENWLLTSWKPRSYIRLPFETSPKSWELQVLQLGSGKLQVSKGEINFEFLRCLAPVITSTVYPGQISSYAININFGDSEREHPFENYELIFVGNAKNITKKLSKTDP